MNSTPEPQTADYDGCNRKCRLAAAHTLIWGECEHGVEPEPTVSLSRVYTAADGFPAIGFDVYTEQQLADLIEPDIGSAELAWVAAHAIVHRNDAAAAVSVAVPPTRQTAPIDWVDGHPQLEAIAAAVWEKCRRTDSGGCVDDDPRNIAVAAYAAVLAVADAEQADTRAAALREAADRFDAHAEKLLSNIGDLAVFVAKARRDQAAVWREAAETLRRLVVVPGMTTETPQPVAVRETDALHGWYAAMDDDPDTAAALPQPETQAGHDVVAAIVAALQKRARELSELAEEQMRPSLEERAQEWSEAAEVARRAAKAATAPAVVSQHDEEA